jgi:hypothetical protein
MNVVASEVAEVITRTAVTGQPWSLRSLRCHVVEPVLDQHRALSLPPERPSSQQAAASVRRISVKHCTGERIR